MKTTIKAIKQHFNEQGYEPRHSFKGLKYAANKVAEKHCIDAWDVLLLVIENQPIEGLYTHSYGFHTREGRYLIDTFQEYYYENENV